MNEDFKRHLEEASRMVRAWPKWKQAVLAPIHPREQPVNDYTPEQIADVLDYEVLSPTTTLEDILAAANYCNKYKLRGLCVASGNVQAAASRFDKVVAMVGFPYGSASGGAKFNEAKYALNHGADEIEVVVNYGRFLGGDVNILGDDLKHICEYTEKRNVHVRAVLAAHLFSPDQLKDACRRCRAAGVTGIAAADDEHDMAILLESFGMDGRGQVKGTGATTYADVCRLLDMGVRRIGATHYSELCNWENNE